MDLTGKTVLVTGSSRNIGQAIAVEMATLGADVGITARSNREGCEKTAELVRDAGGEAVISLGDIGDPDDIDRVVADIRAELGPIDVLVNNATYRPSTPFLDVDQEELDRVADVNFRGIYRMCQAVAPDMIEAGEGSIVNIIGALVYLGDSGHSHSYGAKMSIDGITRQLSTELGPKGVRVNGVSPGLIDVPREETKAWEQREQRITEATPLKRLGEPEEVADACCFLASDRASFITGQVLHVNGGTYPSPTLVPEEVKDT